MEVPTYQRRFGIPGSAPYGSASYGAAMAPAEATSDLAREASRVIEKHIEARRVNELSEKTLEASKKFDELDARMDRQTEWNQIVPEYEAGIKELQTKYGKQIQDPVVRRMFAQDFQKMSLRGSTRARELARKKEIDTNKANLFTTIETYSDDIAVAPDFESASNKIKYAQAAIYGAVAAGTISEEEGVKRIKDFTENAQVNFIRREMLDDPEAVYKGLVTGAYPELDETRKTSLLKESRELAEAEEKKRVRILDQAERDREKFKKDAMEAAYGDALVAYSQGTLTEPVVQSLISRRRIDPDKGSHLLSLLKGGGAEKAKDNPMVVGRIASALELGADVGPDLDAALGRNEIKPETYVSLKKQAGDRDFKRGMYHVNYALKPSDADQWTPDKHIRHAEAVEEYTSRVAAGEPPMVVARSVVETFTSDVRRTIRGIAAPRFLAGEKTSLDALRKAQAETAKAFQSGKISVDDFNREAERIQLLLDLAGRLNDSEQAAPDGALSDRAKEALKKR